MIFDKIKGSLRLKLVLGSVFVEVIMLCLLLSNSVRLINQATLDHAKTHLEELPALFDSALAPLVFQRNYAAINDFLNDIILDDNHGISYIIIYDESGQVYGKKGNIDPLNVPKTNDVLVDKIESKFIHSQIPLLLSNKQVGSVKFGISLAHLIESKNNLLQQGILIAAAEVLFTILLLGLLGWMLTKHIVELVKSADEMSQGKYSIKIPKLGTDEIGKLSESFNKMASAVQEQLRKLQDSEQSLRESKERFGLAMDASKDGLYDWDLVNNRIYYSPGWKLMLGYQDDELPNDFSVWETLTEPEDVKRAWKMQNDLINKNRDRFEMEFKMKHKDGHRVDVLSRANAFFNDSGKAVRIVGTHVDISDRKKSEKALKDSEKRYRNMMEAMTDPLYICSPDKKISYMNPAMVTRIGRDATGETCHKILHNLDEQCSWCVFNKISEGEANETTVNSPLDNRTYRVTNMPVEIDGQVSKMTIYKDITDYLKAVSEKEQIQAKLVQAQKLESIGKLAGGIAHDFNNILYPIIGFAELSQNELKKDHLVQENLTDILNGAKRASDLVKRILHFSRQKDPELKPTILQPVINETQKLLRSTIPSNIDFQLHLYDGQDPVLCDESEIHEIILNLCTNAYHAIAGDQGQIIISLDRQKPPYELDLPLGEYVCLSVKDNGVGIPQKIQDRIFEPYVTTKEVGKGSGLGLSVVYGIVKNYNGDIRVESNPETGTVFEIYLPITSQAAEIDKMNFIQAQVKQGDEHILFVDDENAIVKLGIRVLDKCGYRVTGINDSNEALKVFKTNPYEFDLVITDMAMPGIVGSELAKRMLEIRPDIPIIICSGYSEKLEREKTEDLNLSAFLDKPLSFDDLRTKVRETLDVVRGDNEKIINN